MDPSNYKRIRFPACARCKLKRIKCDSQYPKCTACATRGTLCQQKDHRDNLNPRDYAEFVERQIAQCDALLKRYIPGFRMANLDDISREDIYGLAYRVPTLSHMPMPGPLGTYPVHPGFLQPQQAPEVKGQDPQSLDMSNMRALVKSFGVHPHIVNDSHLGLGDEDLAVGLNGLSSGRDRGITESMPRDFTKWIFVSSLWMPEDRTSANRIVDAYFRHLNIHRPVFFRLDFECKMNAVYDGKSPYDSGFICSMYLILALGTLRELNHQGSITPKWPEHDEFFECALAVKPQLRPTISSLQALLLLHWYLYTEGGGRPLWRLVGSLVRLSIELGLHHDPTAQPNTFTDGECQLRIRLWGIVMVHDRGTSILLGRPLAIAPYESNTPRPTLGADFSEHFLFSHPIAEIQADIINSLYAPRQSAATIVRHASRIIKSMLEFRRQLSDSYMWYFGGTENWPLETRQKLVQNITEDQGLTLLKFGIARILLLRALFSLKELDHNHRSKALVDAIVTSHNIIIIHNQLIRFPDIPFFLSPIPLHIAAMVILHGRMSHCERLSHQVMVEDVRMALNMLSRFRRHWEGNGHSVISKLAERVFNIDLSTVGPTKEPILLLDWETDSGMLLSAQTRVSHPSSSNDGVFVQGSQGAEFYPYYSGVSAAGPSDSYM